ncbi:hypothetical protein BSKO_06435 [Bryopsis sp. KO-2023]|nr:hypothetical protein BSKO_06435 [Bryopsis sp. KO-2023]
MAVSEQRRDMEEIQAAPNPFVHAIAFLAERPSHARSKELLARLGNHGGPRNSGAHIPDPILPLSASKCMAGDEADAWEIFPVWSDMEAFLQRQRERKTAVSKHRRDADGSSAETTPKRQKLSTGVGTSSARISGRRASVGLLDISSEGRTGWKPRRTPSADEVEGWKYLSIFRSSHAGVKRGPGFLRDDVDDERVSG